MTAQGILNELIATMDKASTTESAVDCAVREHARFVFQVAYSLLRNHHDAEDAMQETFLRVLRHEREFEKVDDRRAWLACTAWRIAANKRRRVAHASLDDEENNSALVRFCAVEAGTEQRVITDEMLSLLHSMIETLPSELRDVVTLSTVPEMTSTEIGAALGIASTSVRTRLFRARQLLKEKLETRLKTTSEHGKSR